MLESGLVITKQVHNEEAKAGSHSMGWGLDNGAPWPGRSQRFTLLQIVQEGADGPGQS